LVLLIDPIGTLERTGQQLVQQQAAPRAQAEDASEELETLPFSASTAESHERYSALLEQLEQSRRARHIAVPTNDSMVRARLRELGEPITLFGEQVHRNHASMWPLLPTLVMVFSRALMRL